MGHRWGTWFRVGIKLNYLHILTTIRESRCNGVLTTITKPVHTYINLTYNYLIAFHREEADFLGSSFETIAGAGPNGAIIHYAPSREGPQTIIRRDHMFLLDSGGQYRYVVSVLCVSPMGGMDLLIEIPT